MGHITAKAGAICLTVAVAVGAIAYGVSQLLPKTFSSYGVIRVALPSQQGIIDPVVIAANDTAAQYAQLASSQPVEALAAQKLGVSADSLHGKITGGTLGAQNLVQVTATGSSRASAEARAGAASTALADYISNLNAVVSGRYVTDVQRGMSQIQQNIGDVTRRVAKDPPATRSTDNFLIQELSTQHNQLLGQIARDAASSVPTLQLVNSSTSATQVFPKPWLFALVGFVVALIIAGRGAFVLSRRPVLR